MLLLGTYLATCLGSTSQLLYMDAKFAAGSASPRVQWERVAATPAGYLPQGLAYHPSALVLSAYPRGRTGPSGIFGFDWNTRLFQKLFDMPPEATHTSGLDFDPDDANRLFAADYCANRIYVVDFAASLRAGKAHVSGCLESSLRGTSGCCIVRTKGEKKRLLVTDFQNSKRNLLLRCDLKHDDVKSLGSYRNLGFSQGAKQHAGFIFETGNGLFGSYVVKHRLAETLARGAVTPVAVWPGPHRQIEDLAVLPPHIYVTDEHELCLFRCAIPKEEKSNPRGWQSRTPPRVLISALEWCRMRLSAFGHKSVEKRGEKELPNGDSLKQGERQ